MLNGPIIEDMLIKLLKQRKYMIQRLKCHCIDEGKKVGEGARVKKCTDQK